MKKAARWQVFISAGIGILFLFASCAKQSLFTHRKYTGGVYYETLAAKNRTKAIPPAADKASENQTANTINPIVEKRIASAPLCVSPLLPLCLKEKNAGVKIPSKNYSEKISPTRIKQPVIHEQKIIPIENARQHRSKRITEEFASVLRICMIVLAVIAVILLVIYVFFLSELIAATANLLKISLAVVLLLILAMIILRKS